MEIDGKSEHEILCTLQEMMAVTAYKAKDMKGSHIATDLACGFTGQLKS